MSHTKSLLVNALGLVFSVETGCSLLIDPPAVVDNTAIAGSDAGGAAEAGGTTSKGGKTSKTSASSSQTPSSSPAGGSSAGGNSAQQAGGTVASSSSTETPSSGDSSATTSGLKCMINAAAYADGDRNLGNQCQVCDTSNSTIAWSAVPELASCGNNKYCHEGACTEGCVVNGNFFAEGTGPASLPCMKCETSSSSQKLTIDGLSCGCTASFESVDSSTGLCVTRSVPIAGPTAETGYSIDATEVTRRQYEIWLSTNPQLPQTTDESCGWKSTGTYTPNATCMTDPAVCKSNCERHPVVCVDWCDAKAYCEGVGKRLCGSITNTDVYFHQTASQAQWHRACTSGGTLAYPYGTEYISGLCNDADKWSSGTAIATTTAVDAQGLCTSTTPGYTGVFGLVGNAAEWEDGCSTTDASVLASCPVRGGSFIFTKPACGGAYMQPKSDTSLNWAGFRCCSK